MSGWFFRAWTPSILALAWDRVLPCDAPGVDGLRVPLETAEQLFQMVVQRKYRPKPLLRRVICRAEKVREIGIPCVRDRVIMDAWRQICEPRLELRLADHVQGYRPGRDRFGAIQQLLGVRGDFTLVRCDIRKMFESIDHRALQEAVAWAWPAEGLMRADPRQVFEGFGQDPRVHFGFSGTPLLKIAAPRFQSFQPDPMCWQLLRLWLEAWQDGIGIPMGVAASPALSNALLAWGVDGWLEQTMVRGVRYADDFAFMTREEGSLVLAALEKRLGRLRMELNPSKTSFHRSWVPEDWPVVVLGISLGMGPSGLFVVDG